MLSLSITCIIPIELFKDIGKPILLCLISIIIPIMCILLSIFIILSINITSYSQHEKKHVIYILLSVIYMFFLLETIELFTMMLICRKIGSFYYNPIDLTHICNEEGLNKILKPFSALVLTIWATFPLIIFYFLRRKKD